MVQKEAAKYELFVKPFTSSYECKQKWQNRLHLIVNVNDLLYNVYIPLHRNV